MAFFLATGRRANSTSSTLFGPRNAAQRAKLRQRDAAGKRYPAAKSQPGARGLPNYVAPPARQHCLPSPACLPRLTRRRARGLFQKGWDMVAEANGGRRAIFPVTLRPGGTRFPGLPHFALGSISLGALGSIGLGLSIRPPLAAHLLRTLAARRLVGHGGLSLGTARRPVGGNARRSLWRDLRLVIAR